MTLFRRSLFLLFLLLASAHASAQTPAWLSGSWYNPERNGEGFVVQTLENGQVIVVWFTYPPVGGDGQQAWTIGVGEFTPSGQGGTLSVDEVVYTSGGRFGHAFDPAQVQELPWGSLQIQFEDCENGQLSFSGPAGWGSGSWPLVRLTSLDDIGCADAGNDLGDRVVSGYSGHFFDPARAGEGWMLEMLPNGRLLIYWFSYDADGHQAWWLGVADLEGRTAWITELFRGGGTNFGTGFDPDAVVIEPDGELGWHFTECDAGVLRWDFPQPEYGEGRIDTIRLGLRFLGTSCEPLPPVAPLVNGSWQLSSTLPVAVGESTSAGLGGLAYVAGGVGDLQGFRSYDPATGEFQALPSLPDGRHHPMMAALDGALWFVGGVAPGAASGADNFWKWAPGDPAWTVMPDIPADVSGGAAVAANGRVFVVGGFEEGPSVLQEYHAGRGTWRDLPTNNSAFSRPDHTQAVMFEGEIWQLGGRGFEETNRVFIFNPVTQEWRDGPPMLEARSGHAARVVNGQIMVAGGEIIFTGRRVIHSFEVFAPGAQGWALGPNLPRAVHGVQGASAQGRFVLLGGGEVAGSANGTQSVQVYIP